MSKLTALVIGFGGPLVVWATVYWAARKQMFDLRSMSRTLSAWRVITLLVATDCLICSFAMSPPLSSECTRYFWCALIFSTNLFLPHQWLERKMGWRANSSTPSRHKSIIPGG